MAWDTVYDFQRVPAPLGYVGIRIGLASQTRDDVTITLELDLTEARWLHLLLVDGNPCTTDECKCRAAGIASIVG